MIGTVPRPNRQVGVFPEANVAAEIVLAVEKDQQWLIDAIDFSYSGTPTGGVLTVESGSQTLYKMYLTQSGAGDFLFLWSFEMNLFHDGIDWMRSQLLASVSVEVTYRRNTASVTLSAIVGTTTFEAVNEYGIVERVQTRDYLIPARDLILGGSPVIPMAGDCILESIGGNERTFEVTAQGGEPAFRYSDPTQTIYRIHTKGVH